MKADLICPVSFIPCSYKNGVPAFVEGIPEYIPVCGFACAERVAKRIGYVVRGVYTLRNAAGQPLWSSFSVCHPDDLRKQMQPTNTQAKEPG